jgi:hypothetical protein
VADRRLANSLPQTCVRDKRQFAPAYPQRVVAAGEGYDELLGLAAGELNRLIRRMTQLTTRAWSTRREPVLRLIRELAALDAAVESTRQHEVPELPDYALADATAVIGGDVLEALALSPDRPTLDRLIAELRATWAATR